MYQNGENIKILDRAIQPELKHDRDILDRLWASLPRNPNICWYPSSGLCFRDLMVWKSEGVSGHFEEPDLYIHTDFVADYAASRCVDYEHRDGLSCIQVKSSHTMPVCGPVDHRVRRSWISLPDRAAPAPLVTIKEVVAESFQFGVSKKPVLFFHFENFNWFDQFVIKNGLRISHFFKVREGCGFGGARLSISNLYPKLGAAGCRSLVMDSEVHWIDWLLNAYHQGKQKLPTQPFALARMASLRSLSGFDTHAYRLTPTVTQAWFQSAAKTITQGSDWDRCPPVEALSEDFEPPFSKRWVDEERLPSKPRSE